MSEYYVYVLLDPRKPGIYIYEDLLFFYEPYYVEKAKELRIKLSILQSGSNNGMYGKSRKGFKHTEEAKRKLSSVKSKPVLQIDKKSKEIIKRFSSPKEASIELGIGLSSIHNCLSPNQPSKSAGGFFWRYDVETLYS